MENKISQVVAIIIKHNTYLETNSSLILGALLINLGYFSTHKGIAEFRVC